MLRRIERVHGHGIWDGFRWGTDLPELGRLNLVYGPNGSGKSSLSRALDAPRSEAGGLQSLSIAVEDDGGQRRVTNGQDDAVFDRLYVFCEKYVERSHRFHEGSPNLDAVLTLGERAADAEDKIAELQKELREKTEEAEAAEEAATEAERSATKAYERVSSAVVSDLSRLEGYRSRSVYSSRAVKNRYAGSRAEWAKLRDEDLASKKALVSSDNRDPVPELSLSLNADSDLSELAQNLLGKTPVTIVLDTLKSNPSASAWVQDGHELHKHAEDCAFCGQSLPAGRLQDIERHFSEEVSDLQEDLEALRQRLAEVVEEADASVLALPDQGLLFEDLRETYDRALAAWKSEITTLKKYVIELASRVQSKQKNVLTPVDSAVAAVPSVDGAKVEAVLTTHNERVKKHADLVADAAADIEQHHLQMEAEEVDTQVKAQTDEAGRAKQARARIREIARRIAQLEEVDGDPTPSAAVLTREVARLLGRTELVFQARDGQYVVTRDGEPAVNLSVGERSAIALVHFLEVVACHDAAKGLPIVVIDDPVSSLDSNVFMGISTYIWTVAVKAETAQVVLLTHNFDLFKQWDVQIQSLHKNGTMRQLYPTSLYELKARHDTVAGGRRRRRAVIKAWPETPAVRKKIRSSYHHAFIAVADAKEKLEQDDSLEQRLDAQLLFPNVIRRLLESFLAFKRPDWVGDFTGAMRNAGELLLAYGYEGDADALRQQLTRYAHAYSHSESPETDTTVNPDEIYGAIGAVFVFMNQLDPDHFQGLCTAVGKEASQLLPLSPSPHRSDGDSESRPA